ncbi:type II toxin-antitoxin system HipA family toxin YjjJ [Luteibacter aegosomatissinici]|uniref:type II toxin-antitoxin system HipA family toxin YjjJ n=1 Tax=Luteibacter aegosomatissinici TaxID=2911539 RepID=UPI001FF87365|nr:type II toxin-antitoxin system HipA family toxin YjjJ [Luteibacter aegosomatissinici]UPG93010.1 type II toxin-antitoxin system HipA family toxin YjjJ [Luteibacter aegosomatissinici]
MASSTRQSAAIMDFLRLQGASSAAELAAVIGVSQPSMSRLLGTLEGQVVRIGKARRSQYAVVRDVHGLGSAWPLYRIDAQGRPHALGDLVALYGGGSVLMAEHRPDWLRGEFIDGHFPGVPWFLDDQRPQGFLGRQFAQQWARELGLPNDILRWNDDAVLAALLRHGEDSPGNFVLGTSGLDRALRPAAAAIPSATRTVEYSRRADSALAGEPVGSSAAGEQPKFTARVMDDDGSIRHVIVKFSENVDDPAGRRWADLLICEHLAGEVLAENEHPSARSELIWSGGRLCLEVTRFDRIGAYGRRGFVTLAAWSDAHDGERDTWAGAASRMFKGDWVDASTEAGVRQRWWFGRMIANADMHFGNLGFFLDDALPLTLAPSYDMLPMLYRPAGNGAVVPREFQPATPVPADMGYWQRAASWAATFWERVANHDDVSVAFREIAHRNAEAVGVLRRRFSE